MKAVKFNYVRSNRTAEYLERHGVFTETNYLRQLKAANRCLQAVKATQKAVEKIMKGLPTYNEQFKLEHPFLNLAVEDLHEKMAREWEAVEHTLHQVEQIVERIQNPK